MDGDRDITGAGSENNKLLFEADLVWSKKRPQWVDRLIDTLYILLATSVPLFFLSALAAMLGGGDSLLMLNTVYLFYASILIPVAGFAFIAFFYPEIGTYTTAGKLKITEQQISTFDNVFQLKELGRIYFKGMIVKGSDEGDGYNEICILKDEYEYVYHYILKDAAHFQQVYKTASHINKLSGKELAIVNTAKMHIAKPSWFGKSNTVIFKQYLYE